MGTWGNLRRVNYGKLDVTLVLHRHKGQSYRDESQAQQNQVDTQLLLLFNVTKISIGWICGSPASTEVLGKNESLILTSDKRCDFALPCIMLFIPLPNLSLISISCPALILLYINLYIPSYPSLFSPFLFYPIIYFFFHIFFYLFSPNINLIYRILYFSLPYHFN